MISHCKRVGDIGEANIVAKLLTYENINVSKPVGDNCQYDLVLDIEGRLYRAQIKTTEKVKNDKMFFYLLSYKSKDGLKKFYKRSEVDIFLFYCIETQYFGLAKYEEMPKKTFTINTKTKGDKVRRCAANKIRYSSDFELEKRLKEL